MADRQVVDQSRPTQPGRREDPQGGILDGRWLQVVRAADLKIVRPETGRRQPRFRLIFQRRVIPFARPPPFRRGPQGRVQHGSDRPFPADK